MIFSSYITYSILYWWSELFLIRTFATIPMAVVKAWPATSVNQVLLKLSTICYAKIVLSRYLVRSRLSLLSFRILFLFHQLHYSAIFIRDNLKTTLSFCCYEVCGWMCTLDAAWMHFEFLNHGIFVGGIGCWQSHFTKISKISKGHWRVIPECLNCRSQCLPRHEYFAQSSDITQIHS